MRISVGSQAFSRVVDELFAGVKRRHVFNFLDDLVVYSSSPKEHVTHVREVLKRLQRSRFPLNPEKLVSGPSEKKYLGHLISARGFRYSLRG